MVPLPVESKRKGLRGDKWSLIYHPPRFLKKKLSKSQRLLWQPPFFDCRLSISVNGTVAGLHKNHKLHTPL